MICDSANPFCASTRRPVPHHSGIGRTDRPLGPIFRGPQDNALCCRCAVQHLPLRHRRGSPLWSAGMSPHCHRHYGARLPAQHLLGLRPSGRRHASRFRCLPVSARRLVARHLQPQARAWGVSGLTFGLLMFYGSMVFPSVVLRLAALACALLCLIGTQSATGILVAGLAPAVFYTSYLAHPPSPPYTQSRNFIVARRDHGFARKLLRWRF